MKHGNKKARTKKKSVNVAEDGQILGVHVHANNCSKSLITGIHQTEYFRTFFAGSTTVVLDPYWL